MEIDQGQVNSFVDCMGTMRTLKWKKKRRIILEGGSVGKNPPAMRETWVRSLGWEDPLEEGTATHSSILAWRITMDRGA